MTPEEIRDIPAATHGTKLQTETCAQVAELKEAVLQLLSFLAKRDKPAKVESTTEEVKEKKVERVPISTK